MYLEAFNDNPFDTNCWLLALEGRDEALVIDPGFFPERVRQLLKVAGKPLKNPISYAALIGLIISAATLLYAGRPVFSKIRAFEDTNPG